jgi:hypothetical protein
MPFKVGLRQCIQKRKLGNVLQFFSPGATAQLRPVPPHCSGFCHVTITQSVGLLSTSGQFDAGPLLTQHTTKEETKVHTLSGIRTRDRINRRAAKISPLIFSKCFQIIS